MLNVRRWSAKDKPGLLIVMCHGVGADGSQMGLFVDACAPTLPGAAFLAPDGPDPFDGGGPGRQWFSLRDRTPAVLDAGAARAAPLLDAAIKAECAWLGLTEQQVVLAGFSQGAMMVLHAGLRRVPPPLAILACSGALLDTPGLAAGLSGRPPVLLVHGESDNVVPFGHGLAAAAALRRLGVPVETCWRPGVEHYIDDIGLSTAAAFVRGAVEHTAP